MQRIAILAIALAVLSACAPRYYDDRYDRYDHYYGGRGHADYGDRGRYDDRDRY